MAESIYVKLQKARVDVLENGLKKSKKDGLKFKYFELDDFLESVQKACLEQKLCPVVRFMTDRATLTIYDAESTESIEFECPNTAGARVPNAQEIQNEGAKQTYVRRYLYLAAFEIVESDAVEAASPTNHEVLNEVKKAEENKVSAEELAQIRQMCDDIDLADDTYIGKMLSSKGVESIDDLPYAFVRKCWERVSKKESN